jgi:hypothetical protein
MVKKSKSYLAGRKRSARRKRRRVLMVTKTDLPVCTSGT